MSYGRFMFGQIVALKKYGWKWKPATKAGRRPGWYRGSQFASSVDKAYTLMRLESTPLETGTVLSSSEVGTLISDYLRPLGIRPIDYNDGVFYKLPCGGAWRWYKKGYDE